MASTSQTIRHTLIALGATLAAALPLSAQAAKTGDAFDQWRIQCGTPEGATAEFCQAFQLVGVKESDKETEKRILHVAVAYPPEQSVAVAIFTVPLGVVLTPGIQIKVDDNEPHRFGYNVCLKNGCQAGLKLEGAVLDEFRKGQKAVVTFVNVARQGFNIPVDLKGVSAAMDALKP